MKEIVLVSAALFGSSGILLGAFGAHALKSILHEKLQKSFETGVKYQMYHAITLLVIGNYFNFTTSIEKSVAWFFILGTLLFSFSIYLLCLGAAKNIKMKFLGPVTPLGGLLLFMGWGALLLIFLNPA